MDLTGYFIGNMAAFRVLSWSRLLSSNERKVIGSEAFSLPAGISFTYH